MGKFNVTFTDNSNKYSPTKRTVMVDANDSFHAELLVQSSFGTYAESEGTDGLKDFLMPSKKSPIVINKTAKVKKK